jgi:hypothetical protein
MKIKSLLLSLVFMSSLTMAIGKANAQEKDDNTADDGVKIQSFQCGKLGGTFTTFIHFTNPNGQERKSALIKWTNKYITDANWSPEKRCVAVSKRLTDRFQDEGLNFYLVNSTQEYTNSITGATESAKVICFSKSKDTDANDNSSNCDGIFLTLSPREDANRALLDLQSMFAEAGTVAKEPIVRGVKPVIPLHGLQNQLNNGWKNHTLKVYRVN